MENSRGTPTCRDQGSFDLVTSGFAIYGAQNPTGVPTCSLTTGKKAEKQQRLGGPWRNSRTNSVYWAQLLTQHLSGHTNAVSSGPTPSGCRLGAPPPRCPSFAQASLLCCFTTACPAGPSLGGKSTLSPGPNMI